MKFGRFWMLDLSMHNECILNEGIISLNVEDEIIYWDMSQYPGNDISEPVISLQFEVESLRVQIAVGEEGDEFLEINGWRLISYADHLTLVVEVEEIERIMRIFDNIIM